MLDEPFSRRWVLNLLSHPARFRDSHASAFHSDGSSGTVSSPSQREPLRTVLV